MTTRLLSLGNAFEIACRRGRLIRSEDARQFRMHVSSSHFAGCTGVVHDALVGLQGRAPSHAPHPPCEPTDLRTYVDSAFKFTDPQESSRDHTYLPDAHSPPQQLP
jgi:hypothetical protein